MADTNNYRIAVVDDEEIFVNIMLHLIEKYNAKHKHMKLITDTYKSGTDFLQKSVGKSYDLYFLDIYLGDSTGIDIAKHIREDNNLCEIIFTTSSDKFYKEAYQLQAVQYLEKPVDEKMLYDCLDRIWNTPKNTLNIQDGKKVDKIPIDDILYCMSDEHYKRIFTKNASYFVRSTMKELLAKLPEYFYPVYSRLIINLRHTSEVNLDSIKIDNGKVIEIPKGKYKLLCKEINKYNF